jgi:hypothetical protein
MRIVVSCVPLFRCHADYKICAILFNSLDTKESRAFCAHQGLKSLEMRPLQVKWLFKWFLYDTHYSYLIGK